jgi:hypothetical protein
MMRTLALPPAARLALGCLGFSLTILAVSGCSRPKPAQTPKEAVHRYVLAVSEERLEDAYRMLSRESRAELSYADFEKLIRENPAEVEALLTGLKEETHPPMVTARVTTKSGEVLELHFEDGQWRIDESAMVLYGQSEPRDALSSFVRAYDQKRYDVLLRFVPDSQKEKLTPEILRGSWQGEQKLEMEQIVESLRPDLATGALEVLGDRATMSYGAGSVVELTREHGLWKIEDF